MQARIGYVFRDFDLLRQALTHSSVPRVTQPCASERLEFLGDAALALAVAELLLVRHPDWSEGRLSLARAACVRTSSLAAKARALGLDAALRLGHGEEKTGGRGKVSILAAVYESVIGAALLDGGYGAARELVEEHFAAELGEDVSDEADFKTRLQELVQAELGTTPKYRLIETSGPDHARQFVVAVEFGGGVVALGEGSSKQAAQQLAASRALAQRPGNLVNSRK
ncbi:MAG: ribonuclease III [Deltaproteobacteria bacterium]|nr:ribonuclease III [Deltaproteobacteria bacterium]